MGPSKQAAAVADEAAGVPSKRLRTKGSGGIFLVRDGVWRVDFEVGRDNVAGRRRRVSRQVEGSRRDAEAALARLKVAAEQPKATSGRATARSVRAVLDLYLEAADAGTIELAPRTLLDQPVGGEHDVLHPLARQPHVRVVALHRLTWREIEEMYGAMRTAGASSDWVRRCATALSRSVDFGLKRGLIDSNPAKDAARPRRNRSKPVSPKADQVCDVVDVAEQRDPEIADAVRVLAATGMRKGELLGLQWADVDLDRSEVHVAWAITDAGPGKGVLRKETKRNDWRDVPLTAGAAASIRRQHERALIYAGVSRCQPTTCSRTLSTRQRRTGPTRSATAGRGSAVRRR